MFIAGEVRKAIHKLNYKKVCGLDLILNELLKHSGDCVISVYIVWSLYTLCDLCIHRVISVYIV